MPTTTAIIVTTTTTMLSARGQVALEQVDQRVDEQGDERAGDDPPDDLVGGDEGVAQHEGGERLRR